MEVLLYAGSSVECFYFFTSFSHQESSMRERSSCTISGMSVGAATMENSVKLLQKIKNGSFDTTPGHTSGENSDLKSCMWEFPLWHNGNESN